MINGKKSTRIINFCHCESMQDRLKTIDFKCGANRDSPECCVWLFALLALTVIFLWLSVDHAIRVWLCDWRHWGHGVFQWPNTARQTVGSEKYHTEVQEEKWWEPRGAPGWQVCQTVAIIPRVLSFCSFISPRHMVLGLFLQEIIVLHACKIFHSNYPSTHPAIFYSCFFPILGPSCQAAKGRVYPG